jgi:hypothetical protein
MVSPITAWEILRSKALGEPDSHNADELTQTDHAQLAQEADRYSAQIDAICARAKKELTEITEGLNMTVDTWDIDDAWHYLEAIDSSRYEQLHLTALLRINNAAILWDMVKPGEQA